MVGSSMMMASFGFMIYSVSPVYSNSENETLQRNNSHFSDTQLNQNEFIIGDEIYFVDGGYVYICQQTWLDYFLGREKNEFLIWKDNEFGELVNGKFRSYGSKIKLP